MQFSLLPLFLFLPLLRYATLTYLDLICSLPFTHSRVGFHALTVSRSPKLVFYYSFSSLFLSFSFAARHYWSGAQQKKTAEHTRLFFYYLIVNESCALLFSLTHTSIPSRYTTRIEATLELVLFFVYSFSFKYYFT